MASMVERGIAAALAYAADNSHGYVLRGRHYPGGTDCAGLVRLYAAACEGAELASYPDFGTWSEEAALAARGWEALPFSEGAMRRGDVLLRALGDSTGHTVVYLGSRRIVGAEGNWDGRPGDSTGTEVTERSYYPYRYNRIMRPPARLFEEGDDPMPQLDKTAGAVHRLYNANSGEHLFTQDANEASSLARSGWAYEGAGWVAPKSGGGVWRLYNPHGGDHMLTASLEEVGALVVAGWAYEGRAFAAGGGDPVFRLYNPYTGQHMFTVSAAERDSLVAAGWSDEGTAFFTA